MKIFMFLLLIVCSINVFAGDVKSVLAELKGKLENEEPIAPSISKLIEGDFNFSYPFYFDYHNDHFGSPSNERKVLFHHLLENYLTQKKTSPDLADQLIVVLKKTDRAPLDEFVLFSGIGTYNALDAAAYSCNTFLMKEVFKFVSAQYAYQNYIGNKRISAFSAAYSGGCHESFKYIFEEEGVTPWTDKCDFLKPPFKFKNGKSKEISDYLKEKYEIEDYSSCLRKNRFKGSLDLIGETEMDMLQTLFKLADDNQGADFLEAVKYLVNKYGYTFPWNALVNGETIVNKIIPLAVVKKALPSYLVVPDKKDLSFYSALGLILNYNDSPFPMLKKTDGEYNTFSLMAENCSLVDADFNVASPDYKNMHFNSNSRIKSLLHIFIENNCSYSLKMDRETSLNVLETGCSIFTVPNYKSDSLIGRYFFNTYGFDDYNSCQNSLKKGYEFRIKKGIIPN